MSPIRSAMVLAAGIGTRMRPLTDTRPKPMVEVGGRALIDHVLNRLAEADITTAVVNLHHHADLMERHLRQRRGAPRIVFSDERDALLETGGGIRRALPLLGPAPFISINADTIWIEGIRPNLPTLIDGFDPERMDGLLLLAPTSASIGYDGRGDFVMDGQGALTFRGERSDRPFVYAGAAVLRPELFDDPRKVRSRSPTCSGALPRKAGCSGCGWRACGCTSARRRPLPRRKRRSCTRWIEVALLASILRGSLSLGTSG